MLHLLLPLLLFSQTLWAYQTRTVDIAASKMRASYKATVIVPDSYTVANKRYPVVYLLHGYSGNYQDWSKSTEVESLADQYQVILVMPDGNYSSWYIDSPVKTESMFETYIGTDVVGYIDANFRTIAERRARAISGLSMGGFGALNIALNRPQTFIAAGSLSGGVDPRPFSRNWQLTEVFGPLEAKRSYWDSRAIINNVHRLLGSDQSIYLDCGSGDFFIESNRELHQKLLQLNISHHYSERPGGHSWDYWRSAVPYQILFFAQTFARHLH